MKGIGLFKNEAKVAPGKFKMDPRGDRKQVTIGYQIVICFWTLKTTVGGIGMLNMRQKLRLGGLIWALEVIKSKGQLGTEL